MLTDRYMRPEMGRIWSEQRKFETWLEVELAAAEVMAEAGIVPADAARELREKSTFSIERIDEIEDAYLRGASETEEDHIERKRRKDKRKSWRRQHVRERELHRLSGKTITTRSEEDDEYYLDVEQRRRETAMRLRRR